MKSLFLVFSLLFVYTVNSQTTKKVCFLGNSYTYVNDLPQLISDLALADGNTLIKAQNTPGGYTLNGHSTNSTSLSVISSDSWDYVVLQEQSQLPSFEWWQVVSEVLPYAEVLVDSIRSANACAIPLFFDTWGRRDGDSQWDSIDTFTEMNQRLFNTYTWLANEHSGKLSPVGIGFEHIANDVSSPILFNDLYMADGSHPSLYGSYLAACIFYEIIFETSSIGNTFIPTGITSPEAIYLQNVADHVLNTVDSVDIDFTLPFANFSYTISDGDVIFTNLSEHAFTYNWDFGDGSNSTEENPTHIYSGGSNFSITLTAEYCGNIDDTTITIGGLSYPDYEDEGWNVYPNPSQGTVVITSSQAQINIEIFSLTGQLIYSNLFPQGSHQIDLEPGLYLIRSGEKTIKLLVN